MRRVRPDSSWRQRTGAMDQKRVVPLAQVAKATVPFVAIAGCAPLNPGLPISTAFDQSTREPSPLFSIPAREKVWAPRVATSIAKSLLVRATAGSAESLS